MQDGINALVLSECDNVAVALVDFKAGSNAMYNVGNKLSKIVLEDDIPLYQKFSLVEIKKGETVYKYGQVIGQATKDVKRGQWVHYHNMESAKESS